MEQAALMFNSRRLHLQSLIFALMFIGVIVYEGWKALSLS
jgi:hypothetical protein